MAILKRWPAGGEGPERPRSGDEPAPEALWDVDPERIFRPEAEGYELSMDVFFNARHYVVIDGKRGPVHAHSYRLQVRCRTQTLQEPGGVVVGYHHLRERLERLAQMYNNRLLNDLPPFQTLSPTTEVLVGVLFQQLERLLADLPIELISITLWDTPTGSVTYGRR